MNKYLNQVEQTSLVGEFAVVSLCNAGDGTAPQFHSMSVGK